MQALVFVILAVMFALFAFASARAGEYVVATAAAILAAWMGDIARQAARRQGSRGRSR